MELSTGRFGADIPIRHNEDEDDEDIEETVGERLWGLTEMFPEPVRNGVGYLVYGSIAATKRIFNFTRSTAWIVASSATFLALPYFVELARLETEQAALQQQKQMLLGPGVVGGANPYSAMGGLAPPGGGINVR